MGKINLKHEAVADKKFEKQLGRAVAQGSNAMATLKPTNQQLGLRHQLRQGRCVGILRDLLSGLDSHRRRPARGAWTRELYPPGHEHQARQHEVKLSFHPATIRNTESVAYASFGILLVIIALGLFFEWKKRRKRLSRLNNRAACTCDNHWHDTLLPCQ